MSDNGLLFFAMTALLIILVSIQYTLNKILKLLQDIKAGKTFTNNNRHE